MQDGPAGFITRAGAVNNQFHSLSKAVMDLRTPLREQATARPEW